MLFNGTRVFILGDTGVGEVWHVLMDVELLFLGQNSCFWYVCWIAHSVLLAAQVTAVRY